MTTSGAGLAAILTAAGTYSLNERSPWSHAWTPLVNDESCGAVILARVTAATFGLTGVLSLGIPATAAFMPAFEDGEEDRFTVTAAGSAALRPRLGLGPGLPTSSLVNAAAVARRIRFPALERTCLYGSYI
jgi:hypothetical protein